MKIDAIQIENFMRIRKTKKSFADKEVIGIIAQNVLNKKRANHQGKTTVIEAMFWALTGKARGKSPVDLISYDADFMKVTLRLVNDDGEKFTITRGRTRKNEGSLRVGTIEDMTAAQTEINRLIGMSSEDFEQVFYFRQQDIHQFMSRTPDKKKELMMEWLKNTHWADLEELVMFDVKKLKDTIKSLTMDLANKQRNLGNEDAIQTEFGLKQAKLEVLKTSKASITKTLAELTSVKSLTLTEAKNLSARKKLLIEEEVRNQEALNAKDGLIELATQLEAELVKQPEWKKKLTAIREQNTTLATAHANAINDLKILDKKYNVHITHGTGTCPLINEPCDRITLSDDKVTELKELIRLGNKAVHDCIDALSNNRSLADRIDKKYTPMQPEIDKIKLKLASIDSIQAKIDAGALERKEINTKLAQYDPAHQERVSEVQEELSDIEDQISMADRGIGGLKAQLDALVKMKADVDLINEDLVLKTAELNNLSYVAFMFSKKGIPSLEIENSFQEIEDNASYILAELNDEYKVQFKPDRELGTWEEHCVACGHLFVKGHKKPECPICGAARLKKRKDELRVDVVENGREIAFDVASGGLKTITSLAVRAALSMLIRAQNTSNFSTLFLDEIDSALDDDYRETLMDLITKVFIGKLGFKQVFWISHDKSISQSVPHTLLVKGYKDYSELEWV